MRAATGVSGQRTPRDPPTIVAPALVGRERELTQLAGALASPPAVVLVAGEAGVGKSRLVKEMLATGEQRALMAVCPPYRESLTLGPVVNAVRQIRESVAGLRLSPLAGALRPLFPEWAADLPPSPEPLEDARASRHRLFRALSELIGCLRVELLVVEDVHWADEATLEFLLLQTSLRQSPSMVVTYRPEDVTAESLLLRLSSRMATRTTYVRLALDPLDVAGTAGMVSSMLDGDPVSGAFAAFLHEHTDGLPLAVEESVRLMRDRDDLMRRRDGEWVRRRLDQLQVPPTVRDSVLERVRRLGAAAQHVLESAAVLTEPAGEPVVGKVADLSVEQARAGLTEALQSGLLQEDQHGRVAFRHVLMGRAIYQAIPGPLRRLRHLAAGSTLEATDPRPVAQLTRHFREAGDDQRWCRYADQTAERAIASDDHTTAVNVLNDLLTTAELAAGERARLARRLALAAILRRDAVDDLDRQVARTLRVMLDRADFSRREAAEVRGLLGRLLNRMGEFEAAHAELKRAVPHLDHDPVAAARYLTNLGLPVGPWAASVHLRWLRRAAQVESRIPSSADRLGLTVDRVSALLALGEEAGWAAAAGLPATAPTADERRQIARGNFNIGSAALVWGRYPEARHRLARALDLANDDQYIRLRPHVLIAQAELDWYAGGWDGLAERVAALAGGDAVAPLAHHVAARIVGRLHAAHGARRRAEEHALHALAEAQQMGGMDEALEPAAALGRLHLAEGRVEDALRVTGGPMQTILTKRIWIWATEIAPVRIEALAAAGRVDDAARLAASFARGLRGRDAPAPRAALATCRALVSRSQVGPARAAAAFARAARRWERLPRPYDALLTREQQALCLLADGRTRAGLDLLAGVRSGLSDLDARGDVDRISHVLRENGVDAKLARRGGTRGYGDRLSPRELEVVRLVAAGRTNREIARALSRSPRTIAGQVNSAMRKVKASSRTALAVSAVQKGVLDGRAGDSPQR